MATKIAFIGGGEACLSLLKFIEKVSEFDIVLITDQFRDAPAMRYASEKQIRISTNFLDAVNFPEVDVIIELTGSPEEMIQTINTHKQEKTIFLNSHQANILYIIFSAIINNEFLKIEESFMRNIKDIKKSITDFALITKNIDILAINASIEAARAGEAGKGFAVVASSIKDLVKNSRDTLQYIKSVLEKLSVIHRDMKETRSNLHTEDDDLQ